MLLIFTCDIKVGSRDFNLYSISSIACVYCILSYQRLQALFLIIVCKIFCRKNTLI